ARANLGRLAVWMQRYADGLHGRGHTMRLLSGSRTDAESREGPEGDWPIATWPDIVAQLMVGELNWILLSQTVHSWDVSRTAFLYQSYVPKVLHPSVADVSLLADFGYQPPLNEMEFVSLCIELAESSGLPQGLLSQADDPWEVTIVERHALRQGVFMGPTALTRYVRGAGWGLWLTADLLGGLGGRNRVARDAPVERVIERPTGLWLELTPSPWDMPPQALARIESFLGPVLPSPAQIKDADSQPVFTPPVLMTLLPDDDYADY